MVHLECVVVHYANLNSSYINKPYLKAVKYTKRLNKESFEDLPINGNSKFKTGATTTHKMAAL